MRVLAFVAAIGLAVAGSAIAAPRAGSCPHLAGSVSYVRGSTEHVVSLRTCRDRAVGKAPTGQPVPGVRTSGARSPVQRVWVRGRRVFARRENGRIVPLALSPDLRWLVFQIDSLNSASIAADGLDLLVVSTGGGPVHHLGITLAYPDYVAWCHGELVYAQGPDRIAIHGKRLLVASPPSWRPRALWPAPARTFASPACRPGGDAVAVLSQRSSTNAGSFAPRWQLWLVGLDGSHRLLDRAPPGFADEEPTWSPDGRSLLFVREHRGDGRLMLLRGHTIFGPIANLGYNLGYFGHRNWRLAWRA